MVALEFNSGQLIVDIDSHPYFTRRLKTATTQTSGLRRLKNNLNPVSNPRYLLVRAGGLRLYSSGFNRRL
jgi:hypothetical protein